MENLPAVIEKKTVHLTFTFENYMRDHHFLGKTIVPAVELMQIMARTVKSSLPGTDIGSFRDIDFLRFIILDNGTSSIELCNNIEVYDSGTVRSSITTRQSGKSGITRTKEHVTAYFNNGNPDTDIEPFDFIAGLEGICLQVSPESIYRELVPFGPSYQNINSTLLVSEHGTLCTINGGTGDASSDPLGSPFPLDAAFHAASVWSQRYQGFVGFPVGIAQRHILKKTESGRPYFTRTIPKEQGSDFLIVDIWIYDDWGEISEIIRGCRFRDVSAGKITPPSWIGETGIKKIQDPCEDLCRDISIIELDTINSATRQILTKDETVRLNNMTEKRGVSFTAARLALKKLSRRISGNDMNTPPEQINTITGDRLPLCPRTDDGENLFCSVSHDSRFAAAVVALRKIGIDVERISDRVLKSQRFYMSENELKLVRESSLGEIEASMRIWTIKEAVSKAAGMSLPETWSEASVEEIGKAKSRLVINNIEREAVHIVIDDHILTVIVLE